MTTVKMEEFDNETEKVAPTPTVVVPQEQVKTNAPMGFYPIKDLPSKYKLYPAGTVISGRPLRVLEVKQLSQMGSENSTIVINGVLRTAIRGIDVENLLMADKIYILLWLRANTYKDSGYRVDFTCTKCKKPSDYYFNLDALEIEYIKDDYVDGSPIVLPICKDKVILGYQKVSDVTEMENFKTKKLTNILAEEYDDDILNLASLISSVNEKVMSFKQKYDYLTSLDAGDYSVLETEQDKNEIGVSTLIRVKCSLCGELSFAGLSFRPEFFVPKYKT